MRSNFYIINNLISLIKKNQFFIGVFLIVAAFFIVRLPYFLFMPAPFINGDGHQYYNILNLIESNTSVRIGYPSIGYPLFFLFCEKIHNTTTCIVWMQSLFQLLAVLLFYYYFKVYFRRYILFAAVIITGYLTSNINLYYDSAYHPDSLMGSLFIVSLALFIKIIHKPSYLHFAILSVIVAYAVSVRANGLILVPAVFICMFYLFKKVGFKSIMCYLLIFIAPLVLLSLFNYSSPLYKTFNVFSLPVESEPDLSVVTETVGSKTWNSLLELKLCEKLYDENQDFWGSFDDRPYAIYVMAHQRWYCITLDSNKNIIIDNQTDTRSAWATMNMDSCCSDKGTNRGIKNYQSFKKEFTKKYQGKKLWIIPQRDLKHRLMHFVGFYKLFYKTVEFDNIVLGYENRNFYEKNAKLRYANLFNFRDDFTTENKLLDKRIFKELYHSEKLINEKDKITKIDSYFWKMKTSRFYRWIVHPYYQIHPFLFRNFLYPMIFILVFIGSLIGLLLTKFRSPLFLISFLTCFLLIMMNLFHSFYDVFLYTRYTYQVSFMYYAAVIFFPFMVNSFRKKEKNLI